MFGVREIPHAYLDERAIRANDKEKVLGLVATTNIPVEQTIVWTAVIAMTDSQRDLSSLVQPGNRRMPISFPFDELVPLVRPVDFVVIKGYGNDRHEPTFLPQRVLGLASGI